MWNKKIKNTQLVQFFSKASLKLELDIQSSGLSLKATYLHLVSAHFEWTAVKVHQVNIWVTSKSCTVKGVWGCEARQTAVAQDNTAPLRPRMDGDSWRYRPQALDGRETESLAAALVVRVRRAMKKSWEKKKAWPNNKAAWHWRQTATVPLLCFGTMCVHVCVCASVHARWGQWGFVTRSLRLSKSLSCRRIKAKAPDVSVADGGSLQLGPRRETDSPRPSTFASFLSSSQWRIWKKQSKKKKHKEKAWGGWM